LAAGVYPTLASPHPAAALARTGSTSPIAHQGPAGPFQGELPRKGRDVHADLLLANIAADG